MSWWLILIAVLFGLCILGLSVYIVVIYVAENDRTSAWFPKTVVVFGISLACSCVLLLPLDVANNQTVMSPNSSATGGGLNVSLMWQIVLWMCAAFIVVIIPFTNFFYEAYDPEQSSSAQQIGPAIMYTFVIVVFFVVLSVALWYTEGVAEISYYSYYAPPQFLSPFTTSLLYYNDKSAQTLVLSVSFFVYAVGIMLGIGWVFFCVYGGVGLVALPVDAMSDFTNRPRPMSKAQILASKNKILARANALFSRSEDLGKGNPGRSKRNAINALRAEVSLLERELERIQAAENQTGTGPIYAVMLMLTAVFGGILSLLWLLQIFLYNVTKVNPFLNTFLISLNNAFSLLGAIAYAMFAFYLLWATVKGCFKVGLRLVFFQIHPMKIGDTLMNAMLFNTGLVLLCSTVVVQFCVESFNMYTSGSSISGLLTIWVGKLKGIGLALYYFQFAFVGIAILSIFWVILCPRSKVKTKNDKYDDDDD